MNDIEKVDNTENAEIPKLSLENRLEIIEDGMRKKYLARLSDLPIAPADGFQPLEEDIIDNIRLYRVTEMVYQKGESAVDKFTTVFNTLSTYNTSVYIILDSDGKQTDFYIGVRNNENYDDLKRSTVTLGDTLKNTLIGHFPGIKISNEDRGQIEKLSNKIRIQHNVASVSVVGSNKLVNSQNSDQFVQGLEKLALAMYGRQYVGIIVAENQSPQIIQSIRKSYQDLYTKISPLQKIQFSESESENFLK